jgi:hypothetical protein
MGSSRRRCVLGGAPGFDRTNARQLRRLDLPDDRLQGSDACTHLFE